ncbi:MAG: DEAD/DEAH box helicase [Anaerolineaceae bacterium]|nr:DEAD/DEAH box helicase [Anaerolineaceae bacterium]
MERTSLQQFIDRLENTPDLSLNIPFLQAYPEQPAVFSPFPGSVEPSLIDILTESGIQKLYSHQYQAIEQINVGKNVVISTGTSSGKSLCYQIPILSDQIKTGASTALLLFPTKALANDQLAALQHFTHLIAEQKLARSVLPATYDGDTQISLRPTIRESVSILLTNPDMLHLGILPHHTSWQKFFSQLKYVVVDEIHIYRGVFGSHVANVLRRLSRIANFYGSKPQFILTSATVANAQTHAEKLIDAPVELINEDGSPHGKKLFALYNPPIVNQELGVRQGLITTAVQFSELTLQINLQSLLFARSRRSVELIIHELKNLHPNWARYFRSYRSGYLKSDRREIEQGLKDGSIRLTAATNALELGVDIGGVDLVLMAGYPGTVASTRQQSGRAGRKHLPSAAVLIASMNPLDQFLCRHPEYIMEKDPEAVLIDPDNPLILLQQLQCASFELPFRQEDGFGSIDADTLHTFFQVLIAQGVLVANADRYLWMSQDYPANSFSLRSTAARSISLQLEEDNDSRTLGELDYASSLWMTHPGAIYLHEGDPYFVKELDLEKNVALLEASNLSYFTEPIKSQKVAIIQDFNHDEKPAYDLHFSEVEVTTQITGYKKIDWNTREILAIEPLEMPETVLRTYGFWMAIQPATVEKMRQEKMWLSDPNDYGANWEQQRRLARERDHFCCSLCGAPEGEKPLHVHHKIPFKLFTDPGVANQLSNLVTLCSNCHRLVEMNVKIRSAISGLNYSLSHLAPLQVMCDENDLGSYADPAADFADQRPVIMLYDAIPAGMGLAQTLYTHHQTLLNNAADLIDHCACDDGCPSCVGPISETGLGGKKETRYLLTLLSGDSLNA